MAVFMSIQFLKRVHSAISATRVTGTTTTAGVARISRILNAPLLPESWGVIFTTIASLVLPLLSLNPPIPMVPVHLTSDKEMYESLQCPGVPYREIFIKF